MDQAPRSEMDLLTEIARLYAALIQVVRVIDDPHLKAEIAALIWPPKPLEDPVTEPVVVVVATKRTWLSRIPPWLRAAIITSAQVAVGYLLLIVLNLLVDIQSWLSDPTNPVDLSTPAKLTVGVLVTFITGVVTAIYRAVRPPQNTYPEMPTIPDPPKP